MNCSLHDSAGKKQGQELYHIILYHKNQSKVRVPVTNIVQPYRVFCAINKQVPRSKQLFFLIYPIGHNYFMINPFVFNKF